MFNAVLLSDTRAVVVQVDDRWRLCLSRHVCFASLSGLEREEVQVAQKPGRNLSQERAQSAHPSASFSSDQNVQYSKVFKCCLKKNGSL